MMDMQVYWGLTYEDKFGPYFAQGLEIRPLILIEVCENVEVVRGEEVYGTKY